MVKGLGRKIAAGILAVCLLGSGGAVYYTRTENFTQSAAGMAAELGTSALGVELSIGEIEMRSLHDLVIHDIVIYDKQAEPIASAEEAQVGFRLLAALGAPSGTVDTVEVRGLKVTVEQRPDGSWNVSDIDTGKESGSGFFGKVLAKEAEVTLRAQGRELTLTEVEAELDGGDWPAIAVSGRGRCEGAELAVSGEVSSDRQILNIRAEQADLEPFLPLLPEGLVPAEAAIKGGMVTEAQATVIYQQGLMSLTGQGELRDGRLQVLGTDVEKVNGRAWFTDREVIFHAEAEAAGQQAKAHGTVRLDTDKTYLDVEAESESFDPGKILTSLPCSGAAKFKAHFTGSADDPLITGEVDAAQGEAFGLPFAGAHAAVRFAGGRLYLQELRAEALGGRVSGEGELEPKSLGFTAHLKTENIDLPQVSAALPNVPELAEFTGSASADLGLSGVGDDLEKIEAYGSAKLENASFRDLPIEHLAVSFRLAGDDVTVDFLSARLPGHSDVGLEGKITDGRKLDLAFYGGHVDMALLAKLLPEADVSGIADFKGEIKGDAANPDLKFSFSATDGRLFKQPYDSVLFKLSGSLDGVRVDDFSMMKNGKQTWYVDGTVGLTGERRIDLRADTVAVRMEDLAALIAPDQPITGNVDNTIRFTGTLDNPHAVGYVHFYRGSYMGVLLSGMDGDYFLENGVVRLQDFHIYSPMVDMDVNGTVTKDGGLDLATVVHDIDMKRLQHKLPYDVSGHGVFDGHITGSIGAPHFRGVLDAPGIIMNGVELSKVHGQVDYAASKLTFSHFGLQQGEGSYDLELSVDVDSHEILGNVVVQQADVAALCAVLNLKNELVSGKLDAGAEVSGTLENASLGFGGRIPVGQVAGYEVRDVHLGGYVRDKVLYFKDFSGTQGSGSFYGNGELALYEGGPCAATLSGQGLSLGLFARAFGVDADVSGTANVDAVLGGYRGNPSLDVSVYAVEGGVHGATFDSLNGDFHLRNGLLDVEQLLLQKSVGGSNYRASMKGVIPSKALTVDDPSLLDDYEQIRLDISLDNADLSLLPTISRDVDWAMGPLKGNLTVTGTLAHPLVNGSVNLREGAVKLKALELPFTDMILKADFTGHQMAVREFSGRMGKGTYTGSGELRMNGLEPEYYNFDLRSDGLEIISDFFTGPLDAELHLSEGDFYGRKLPKLSGRADFHDCLLSVPALPSSDSELPDVMLDFHVNVGKKVHFYSPALYDMYLTGTANFEGTTRYPKSSGQVEVKNGGTVTYLGTRFKIREGSAYFNQVGSFLPSISFLADTRIGRTKIYLNLNGPLGGMDVKLGSMPEHSQTEILQILTIKNDYLAGDKSQLTAGDLLSIGLQMTVLADVEMAMREILFLDTFSVIRGETSNFSFSTKSSLREEMKDDYSILVGKNLNDKLQINVMQGVGSNHDTRYGLRYDFTDRLGLILERERDETIIGLEGRISF